MTNHPYEDIIHLDRPISKTHIPMSLHDRAAQFAPFAALRGHKATLDHTAEEVQDMVLHEIEKVEIEGV